MKALDRWDEWRRMRAAPNRIDELEARVRALETAATATPLAEACPICTTGRLKVTAVRPHPTFGRLGVQEHSLACDACQHTEARMHDPTGRVGKR